MAKKNSSKTATEKAIQSSEPRVVSYRGWKGVNYVDSPLTWEPLETGPGKFRQTDLPQNYLMVQNNVVTTPTLGLETRADSLVVGKMPGEPLAAGYIFTGVAAIYRRWIFCAVRVDDTYEVIFYRSLLNPDNESWNRITVYDSDATNPNSPHMDFGKYSISEIGFYEGQIVVSIQYADQGKIALAKVTVSSNGNIISIMGTEWSSYIDHVGNKVVTTPFIPNPKTDDSQYSLKDLDWPALKAIGMKSSFQAPDDNSDTVVRLDIVYCYVNRMGSTLASYPATIYVEYSPALWSSKRYLRIQSRAHDSAWSNIYSSSQWTRPTDTAKYADSNVHSGTGITGIDFYARENENTDYVFIGHLGVTGIVGQTSTNWKFNWLGNMTDTSQWENSQLQLPTDNTSLGPNVTHFNVHDSRMYYWGQPDKPYRLYIGGNPGAEFSIARGLGGAWVDIEPGSGFEIAGTAKWKTVQGANIVTIMCGNRNTNKVKRFNLVETNITITNEITYKNYMYEEVSNVVGCNSRWGYGVFSDGLYSLSRYGLMLTTMAMEYNSQMKNQNVSEVVKPIFTERIGNRLRDGRMVCIDDVIYIALSEDQPVPDTTPISPVIPILPSTDDSETQEPISLDNVILCYDIGLQAWYTFTHDQTYSGVRGSDPDKIHHIFAIDSDEHIEGLGVITDTEVRLYPTTGIQDAVVPEFQVIIESGEMMPKMPMQVYNYVQQLEFRFDYLVGNPDDPATILVEGVDYYGRHFEIEKKINVKSRGNHGLEGEQRNYVEWIRVEKIVESIRIRIKGRVRFRLSSINSRIYTESNRIATPYGFDAGDSYRNRHGNETKIHHYINDYNNLRRALVT